MRTRLFIVLSIVALLASPGCKKGNHNARVLLTDRIQYDVSLKNTDSTADWWVQNMDGKTREAFVKLIFDKAYSGDFRVYSFFNPKPMTLEQVKAIGNRADTLSIARDDPPYDLHDTIVKTELRLGDIRHVRFLETWYWNEDTKQIEKEVTGICPLLGNYSPSGEFRGNQPLFWIALSDKFPFAEDSKK